MYYINGRTQDLLSKAARLFMLPRDEKVLLSMAYQYLLDSY